MKLNVVLRIKPGLKTCKTNALNILLYFSSLNLLYWLKLSCVTIMTLMNEALFELIHSGTGRDIRSGKANLYPKCMSFLESTNQLFLINNSLHKNQCIYFVPWDCPRSFPSPGAGIGTDQGQVDVALKPYTDFFNQCY